MLAVLLTIRYEGMTERKMWRALNRAVTRSAAIRASMGAEKVRPMETLRDVDARSRKEGKRSQSMMKFMTLIAMILRIMPSEIVRAKKPAIPVRIFTFR